MSRPRLGCAAFPGLFFLLAAAHGQPSFSGQNLVHSVSGQFEIATVPDPAPWLRNRTTVAGTNVVRLEPALLAVAAERFKISLWRQLGIPSDAPWSGKIFLTLHPARSPDEAVTIESNPFFNHWNYRVDFPDARGHNACCRAHRESPSASSSCSKTSSAR